MTSHIEAKDGVAVTAQQDNHASFDRIINFRDVGSFINNATGRQIVQPGLLFRSARPDGATQHDRELLTSGYGMKTIIDLRTPTEHVDARRKYVDNVPTAPAVAPSDPKHPLRIPGINYKEINFNGSSYSKALIQKLTWRQTAKLASLYCVGYRKEAISVLGTNVMAERGLVGLAEDSLQHCTAEVKAEFDILADKQAYPLLVHCTQGKDRTGITVLLVLMLLGVPLDAVEKDYRLSESKLEPEREDKLEEIRSIGLPDSFADCPADWVTRVSGWINEKHGGVEKYLASCDIDEKQQAKVREILQGS